MTKALRGWRVLSNSRSVRHCEDCRWGCCKKSLSTARRSKL